MKRIIALLLAIALCFVFTACGDSSKSDSSEASSDSSETTEKSETESSTSEDTEQSAESSDNSEANTDEAVTVHLYIAASLENAFKDIIEMYKSVQPNVTIEYNADSSGTLLTQIEEANGAGCDIFFSAAVKQIKTLDETDHLMVEGSRVDLLKNQVALITYKGSNTAVTGLANLGDASSIALADGSVPVGKYTRQALVNAGLLDAVDDVSAITTEEISAALGGVDINECGNVSKVKEAVKEGSNEVGTVYYSDAYSVKDDVDIIEMVSTDLTGEILYPVCRVINPEADDLESAAADDFMAFLQTPEVLAVYENYMFIVNSSNTSTSEPLASTTVHLYIAASLENAFKDIIEMYKSVQPNVTVEYNADSSGTLLTQIEEANGAGCDIFFSAAVKQIKTLDETDHLMVEGSRVDLLKNQVALITYKGSNTAVTGLANIGDASSIALADGSVPVGKYTRQALVNAGLLDAVDDVSAITTEEISAALGGVDINECGNVSKVKEAVKEGSNEVGTVYYSDAYSVKDDVDIIEMVSTDLTGEILYPVCRVINPEADDLESAAANDFIAFLQTPEVLAVYENYMFIVNEG